MRTGGYFFILVVMLSAWAVTVSATNIPDLTGEWKAVFLETDSQLLGYEANDTPVRTIYVEEQNGRIFEGYKEYLWTDEENSRLIKEQFLGTVSDDGSTVYINDYSSGFSIGEIHDDGSITFYYMHTYTASGERDPAVAVAEYVRSDSVTSVTDPE